MLGPIHGVQGQRRSHGFKVAVAMEEGQAMFHGNRCDQAVGGGRGNAAFPQTSGMVPSRTPPPRIERHTNDRGEPMQQGIRLLVFRKAGHEFQQDPFGDNRLSVGNQRPES